MNDLSASFLIFTASLGAVIAFPGGLFVGALVGALITTLAALAALGRKAQEEQARQASAIMHVIQEAQNAQKPSGLGGQVTGGGLGN